MKYGWTVSFCINNMYRIHLYCFFQTFSGTSDPSSPVCLAIISFWPWELINRKMTKKKKCCNYDILVQKSFIQAPKNFNTSHYFCNLNLLNMLLKKTFFTKKLHSPIKKRNILASPTKNTSRTIRHNFLYTLQVSIFWDVIVQLQGLQ